MKSNATELQKRRVRLLWLAFALGCDPGSPPDSPLEGHWTFRMESAGGAGANHFVTTGMLVLNPDLPRYPDDPEPSDSTIVGRAYVGVVRAGSKSTVRFQEGPGADRIETVHVFLRRSQVAIHLAPHVTDASPILTGRVTPDGISGTWSVKLENASRIHGTFTMERSRASEYSDSAALRAARGVRQFDAS